MNSELLLLTVLQLRGTPRLVPRDAHQVKLHEQFAQYPTAQSAINRSTSSMVPNS